MAKFNLTDTPHALPGCCFLCRSSDRELYIDVNLSVEPEDMYPEYGAVYICVDECLREIVGLTGFITPDQAQAIARQNRELTETVDALVTSAVAVEEVKGIVDGFLTAYGDLLAANSIVTDSNVSEDSEPSVEEPSESDGGPEESEQGPSEQSNDEGVVDVHADSGRFQLPGL